MEYSLDVGPDERAIVKQAIRTGQPIPDRIANAPELILGLFIYIDAFFDLDSERSYAQGPLPIPWSSIANYAQTFDFDDEQTGDLFYFIKKLDAAYLKRMAKNNG